MDRVLDMFPRDIQKLIYSYSRLDYDLRQIRLRPTNTKPRPWNLIYFRNWAYFCQRLLPGRDHVWIETPGGGVFVQRAFLY